MEKRTLLVTGGSGFIGLTFLKYISMFETFISKYNKIYNLDKFGYASEYNIAEYKKVSENLSKYCEFKTLNMTAESFGEEFDGTFDHGLEEGSVDILDFASESHVDNSIKRPAVLYKENSKIPADILAAFGSLKSINRYYHISTDEVYGDLPLELRGVTSTYFTTKSQFKPSNPYSASKVAQDAYLNAMCKTFKLPVSIIRMANQYGFWQHAEKMIPASIIRALKGEKIKIYGDGKNCRQWTFVWDTVRIISEILERNSAIIESEKLLEIYHLADMQNLMDNNALIWQIKRDLKYRHNIDVTIEYVEDRLGHDLMYALSVNPAISKQYITNFEDSLSKTISFYVERFKNGDFP